ncbi:restriction endonuclease subunit S [Acinetobacter indicus]|uniref:restriction endonuclease subunit S n=1 Tax=Acinetobacter indicus TaxID=756892 RepID=UPI00144422FD|nr:restriction endonuclease subunit S [Acinetobacter indicus]
MAAPKLRFKEFDGDWSQSRIGEIFQVTSGSTPLRSDNRFFENADIAWVKTTDLNNGLIEKTEEKISQIALKETSVKILPKGTVFVAMYGGFNQIGRTGLLVDEAACNQALSAIYPNEKIESYFLLTFLNHKVDDWKNFAASSRKDPNITKSDVLAFPLTYPVKEEQTKIASFLSAVDEKISQLTQKHELLSQYKQGMMQKLFSQEIRFKAVDGSEFGEWEETTISKISSTISTGATPSTLKEEYWNGNIKWMSSGELNHRHVHDVEKTITELGFKSSSTKILPKHCVLIGLAGQGKTRGTVAINYIELCTNQSIAAIHPNPKVFDYRFIFFNLDMRYQELRALSTGDGGRGGLNLQIIKGVEIHLPCLEEQTKIANFLSSIDQKIEVVAQQIEQAKTWKKGLLQQMFV